MIGNYELLHALKTQYEYLNTSQNENFRWYVSKEIEKIEEEILKRLGETTTSERSDVAEAILYLIQNYPIKYEDAKELVEKYNFTP
jgi:hypothetical protein